MEFLGLGTVARVFVVVLVGGSGSLKRDDSLF